MIPIFTTLFFLFCVVFTFALKKSSKAQDDVEQRFWEREREANTTLRNDTSDIRYINIPNDFFPSIIDSDLEKNISIYNGRTVANFTGMSNTDLKLKYGVLNFKELSEYDTDFTEMVALIAPYCKELIDSDHTDAAEKILKFAVDIGADAKSIYTLLADIYRETCSDTQYKEKIEKLTKKAGELNSLASDSIVRALTDGESI